ncbi:MAG: indole-3-glycerol phosphate synthase TrpC [Chitinophagales bacterium]|nr:indole-3-glycerol phosphate synthase TrpC [Chitinophagales bacterium]
MNILEEIISHKQKEIAEKKINITYQQLEHSDFFRRPTISLQQSLLREDRIGIIAEIKRKSPSKGNINRLISVERTAAGYLMAGASGVSVLTDQEFFGGKDEDLNTVRNHVDGPILRKEFIVDEYQIIESKALGADVILLLANVLDEKKIKLFSKLASSIGLEILLEVHNKEELKVLNEEVNMVGVNNRDLKDFSIDIQRSFELSSSIPDGFIKISESGINSPQIVYELKNYGYRGFLIGEHFMKDSRPDLACANFIYGVETFHPEKMPVGR